MKIYYGKFMVLSNWSLQKELVVAFTILVGTYRGLYVCYNVSEPSLEYVIFTDMFQSFGVRGMSLLL